MQSCISQVEEKTNDTSMILYMIFLAALALGVQIGFILSDTPIPSRWRVKTFHLIGRFDPARIIDIDCEQ